MLVLHQRQKNSKNKTSVQICSVLQSVCSDLSVSCCTFPLAVWGMMIQVRNKCTFQIKSKSKWVLRVLHNVIVCTLKRVLQAEFAAGVQAVMSEGTHVGMSLAECSIWSMFVSPNNSRWLYLCTFVTEPNNHQEWSNSRTFSLLWANWLTPLCLLSASCHLMHTQIWQQHISLFLHQHKHIWWRSLNKIIWADNN